MFTYSLSLNFWFCSITSIALLRVLLPLLDVDSSTVCHVSLGSKPRKALAWANQGFESTSCTLLMHGIACLSRHILHCPSSLLLPRPSACPLNRAWGRSPGSPLATCALMAACLAQRVAAETTPPTSSPSLAHIASAILLVNS